MRVIAFHAKHNVKGKRDVTGAFKPECERFMAVHGGHHQDIHVIDNSRPKQHQTDAVLDALKQYEGKRLDAVAFFCHGWQTRMQFGFNIGNADVLARAVYAASENRTVCVPLFLCSVGGGPDAGASSFADALRDALCREGAVWCRVMGHRTAGHTTRNPNASFFDGMGSPVGGVGGYPVVSPGSEPWRAWQKALQGKDPNNPDFRLRFPFMTVAEIHAALLGTAPTVAPAVRPAVPAEWYKVKDGLALIRSGPPTFKTTGRTIPKGTFVTIEEERGENVRVTGMDGADYRWTRRTNLSVKPADPNKTPPPEPKLPPLTPLIKIDEDVYTVTDANALIRGGAPDFASLGKKIKRYTRVNVKRNMGKYARVMGLDGQDFGVTAKSNLTLYHKDNSLLQSVSLAPQSPCGVNENPQMAKLYNRLGGIFECAAQAVGIHPASLMAVWSVEALGAGFKNDLLVIRFENHLFYRNFGEANPALFDAHFQFGGHAGIPGAPWKNHTFREKKRGPFVPFHGKQPMEHTVLDFASSLSDADTALLGTSMGGPQILGANHRRLGYPSPSSMFEAFKAGERAHVLGFLDFCEGAQRDGKLIRYLSQENWVRFATYYNGTGKAEYYGNRLKVAFGAARNIVVK